MKTVSARNKICPFALTAVIPIIVFFLCIVPAGAEDGKARPAVGLTGEEIQKLGERMYRSGILPSGKPMEAVVKGDIPVAGTAFTCASCHLRSGLGSFEGLVYTPPTDGGHLFRPLRKSYRDVDLVAEPPLRPAYTDKTLGDVIRGGIDPTGRKMNDIMPRYMLDAGDMAILISYLKTLSSQLPPGATRTTLHFATVVTDDVSGADRQAMLTALRNYIASKNNQVRGYKKRPRNARMEGWWASKYLTLSLSEWLLTGPPETCRSQLEQYNRTKPAFALIGGISTKPWKPIHDFSEEYHLPTLLPLTDLPVVSETDWYTLYFSKGFYQEGEAAARYLDASSGGSEDEAIAAIVRDSAEGRALSRGFLETWQGLGHRPVATTIVKEEEPLTAERLEELAGKKPAVVLIWDGRSALPALEAWASGGNLPGRVFVSAGYIGKGFRSLSETLRGRTFITYPFGLSQDEKGYGFDLSRTGAGPEGDTEKIVKRMNALFNVLTEAIVEMRGNYYRDNFFDVIGMMQDQKDPLYERLSFGPGQRYASKGCYIIQLGGGPDPEMIKKSEWAMY